MSARKPAYAYNQHYAWGPCHAGKTFLSNLQEKHARAEERWHQRVALAAPAFCRHASTRPQMLHPSHWNQQVPRHRSCWQAHVWLGAGPLGAPQRYTTRTNSTAGRWASATKSTQRHGHARLSTSHATPTCNMPACAARRINHSARAPACLLNMLSLQRPGHSALERALVGMGTRKLRGGSFCQDWAWRGRLRRKRTPRRGGRPRCLPTHLCLIKRWVFKRINSRRRRVQPRAFSRERVRLRQQRHKA